MIFGLFRRANNDMVIDRLYETVVGASRQPVFYTAFAVPDTFEGRFESLTLHAALMLRRMRAADDPGPDMAQHLVDTIFRHFDRMLREMGVGDTAVPKRMKRLAEAFLGRSTAYDEALRGPFEALREALARNVYAGTRDAAPLARYAAGVAGTLASAPIQDFVDGRVAFPDPEAFLEEATL